MMRNWMAKERKWIAFGLAVILTALQFAPMQFGAEGTRAAQAAGVSQADDKQRAGQNAENGSETADPEETNDPEKTNKPGETAGPGATERPPVLEPDQVEYIIPTGDAMYLEDKTVYVRDLKATERTTDSLVLSWTKAPVIEATGYYIYQYDFKLRDYVYVDTVKGTEYTVKDLQPGEELYYTVSAYNEEEKVQTYFCTPLHTYTRPERLASIAVKSYAKTSITLQWNKVASATGYSVYRATETGGFALVGSTSSTSYKDTGLTNGTTYRYMVCTYAHVTDNTAEQSSVLYMTTKVKAPTIKAIKGGHGRVRIKWKKLSKATGYQIYRLNGTQYTLIATLPANTTVKYINTGLVNGQTYRYKVCGYRRVGNVNYAGDQTKEYSAKAVSVGQTSKTALLFKSKKAFKKSSAYKACTFFKKKVKYAKSIIIPGLQNTNLNGFGCSSMVPQGITFAKSYMLISAYDKTAVENSVLYVVKKSSKKLITTVELPSQTHAGGIAYDGRNIWITSGSNMLSIPFSTISSAASKKLPYLEIPEYASKVAVGQQAATVTYYKSKLWIASYNELSSGYLGSYTIVNKNGVPSLSLCSRIKVGNRVQGMTFTSKGYLILSRSCQTNSGQRGFLHQLDVYKPNVKKASKGIIKLGRLRKHVDMPTMNEEIAVSGSYLYVNYESGAFSTAVNRMDRICAFKVSAIIK